MFVFHVLSIIIYTTKTLTACCSEPPKRAHLVYTFDHSLQTCEEVPGITTPPQSPPDSTTPATHSGGVPVIPNHAAAPDTSSLQGNASTCTQQELQQQKTTPVNTNETLNKGYSNYCKCIPYYF